MNLAKVPFFKVELLFDGNGAVIRIVPLTEDAVPDPEPPDAPPPPDEPPPPPQPVIRNTIRHSMQIDALLLRVFIYAPLSR
jgi:hypothetical protein